MKKLNNKQIEAISSAWANLANILFLGIGVGLFATGSRVSAGAWVLILSGWLFCQVASILVLSYWRKEDE
jgi:hypothetical protein